MRRRFAYVLVWAVATAVTVSGSWFGLRSMLEAGGGRPPAPVSAAELRQAAPTVTPAPSPTPRPTAAPSPSRTRPKAPAPSKSSRPPAPSPTPGWREISDGRPGRAYQRRFRVQGGEAVVVVTELEVRIDEVRPGRGYRGDVGQWAKSVRISFVSERHTSRIVVFWRNGPYAEVSESV